MENKLYIGKYLIDRGLISEADVIKALQYQSEMTPSFIDMACKKSMLDIKDAYGILTYQVETDLSFEEAALRGRFLTKEQIVSVNNEREASIPKIGDVFVHLNMIDKAVFACEVEKFNRIKMRYEEVFKILSSFEMFNSLGEAMVESLAYIGEKETYSANKVVYKQDQPSDCFYCVHHGSLKAVRENPSGQNHVYLYTIKEQDMFGETALFEDRSRSTTIITLTETVLIKFNRDAFIDFLKNYHRASFPVLMFVIKRLISKLQTANHEIFIGKSYILETNEAKSP